MKRSIRRAGSSWGESLNNTRFNPFGKLTTLVVSGLIYCAPLGGVQTVSAEPLKFKTGDVYSALRDVARPAQAEAPEPVKAEKPNDPYSALREFARRVGIDKPESLKGQQKLAEADDAFDALRNFFQKGSEPAKSRDSVKPKINADAVDATYVGEKVCMTCHASHAAEFDKTLMGRIGKTKPGTFACENCHGPGSAHVKAGGGRGVGGIISFRSEDQSRSVDDNNLVCLNCHQKGNRTNWPGSTHEVRNVACTNCHTVMKRVSAKNQLKTEIEADTCFQCHKNKRAEIWRSSHMPVREGKMTCSSCHNPHGSYSEALLRTATINDTCYKCHAEKRGPFLFEHAPVRESCVNCHDPHGSINDSMLKVSRPRLCQQCHTAADHPGNPGSATAIYALNRSCSNCHAKIHGSNSPAGPSLTR